MFTNGFSVEIIADRITKKKINNEIVYAIPHRTYYKIKLGNQTYNKCVAVLFISGKRMGAFEIESMNTILIDRPVFKYMPFNFLFEKSDSYNPESKNKTGYLEVVFLPEKMDPVYWKFPKPQCSLPKKDYNIESYIKLDHNKDISNHVAIYPKKEDYSDNKVKVTMKIIEDTDYVKPFVSKLDMKVADRLHIPDKKVPKVRQYDDFFFMTEVLPY
jgi:hypothetical protein